MSDLKFKGIDLSPGALIMRKKSDELAEIVAEHEELLAQALAMGAGTPALRQAAGASLERHKAEIARIEALIITC
jgi:hypothetical protein